MHPPTFLITLGAAFFGLSSASLLASPPEFGKEDRLSSGKVTFGSPGQEYQIGQYELTLRPSPVFPNKEETTVPGAQPWRPAGGGSSTDWRSPLPGASASGSGLSLDLLRITDPNENFKPPAVKLTGDAALFSGAAQFTGISDQDVNAGWLRESVPGPAGGVMSALWAVPFVFGLVVWLLLGFEKGGHRRRRSSSRGIPARPLSPRRRR